MKKLLAWIIIAALSLGVLTGCSSSQTSTETQESAAPVEETVTDGEQLGMVETLYDPDFSIELLGDGIKRVIDGEGRELILVPKTLEEVPEEYADCTVIRTPVERAVLLSATQVCAFRVMNDDTLIDRIAGTTSDVDNWSDMPAIQEAMKAGKITYIGASSSIDYELLQSLDPDIVFVYTGSSPQTEQIEKLEELGINYAVDNEYMESNYMARMEWMRFLMTFMDADDSVDEIMLNASESIEQLKTAIEGVESPKVAIFSVSGGLVYATMENSWLGSMLSDLGIENVFAGVDSKTMSEEVAFEIVHDADIIIYSSTTNYTDGMAGIMDRFPLIEECQAYENGQVYLYGSTFYHGIDQTDIMAWDLAAIVYPDTITDREISYFVKAE